MEGRIREKTLKEGRKCSITSFGGKMLLQQGHHGRSVEIPESGRV
jgi:hypothetical protein